MLNSAPKGPQATQPEISQNVADILRLHEDILVEIKPLVPDGHTEFNDGAHHRPKHARWYSVESTEAESGASVSKAWAANDFSWFGSYRDRSLMTTPAQAADVARVFERMVRDF